MSFQSATHKVEVVGVIGAGTMGQGIAQLALQAGHQVVLVDQSTEQLEHAVAGLTTLFDKFVKKNKVTQANRDTWLSALTPTTHMAELAQSDLVIEAIVERLDVKQSVFSQLETLVAESCLLATNTSSLSVTAIASCLKNPNRFIGLHFFNPPGIMPLVEVIEALQTDSGTTAVCMTLMQAWGKSPVRCKNTPGFIVNRVARPFYVESFRLLEDQLTTPADLDASIRSVGFRMGPCELTDFIGQDVNYAVSCSLFDALFYPTHLRPSLIQGSLVEAGFLGRKSGRGFYSYDQSNEPPKAEYAPTDAQTIPFVIYGTHEWVTPLHTKGSQENATSLMDLNYENLEQLIQANDLSLDKSIYSFVNGFANAQEANNDACHAYIHHVLRLNEAHKIIGILANGVVLCVSDGRMATQWENQYGVPIALCDIKHPDVQNAHLAVAYGRLAKRLMSHSLPLNLSSSPQTQSSDASEYSITWFLVPDLPALINLRVISMIINEAIICSTQGIAEPEGIDSALKGGVNYPLGAYEWLNEIGITTVVNALESLQECYGSHRYHAPPRLLEMLHDRQNNCTKEQEQA